MTDLHVMDASSPLRAEHLQFLGNDAKWRHLLPMHRPYELLVNHALAMMIKTIRRHPAGVITDVPYEAAIVTGDCTDNAQLNELDAYLAILNGGTTHFPYDGVQSTAAVNEGFWCPDPSVHDDWKRDHGYPSVTGLLETISAPMTHVGLGVPLVPVIGNHDVLRQGTSLTTHRSEVWATGSRKATGRPVEFDPADPFADYLADPICYNDVAPTRVVRADSDRRIVSQAEWVARHRERSLGFGSEWASGTGADYVHDLEHVRIIVLDTNHPFGHYEGSIGVAQLQWLDERLSETTKLVVVASHHGAEALTNTTPGEAAHSATERELGAALVEVLHRHRNVIAWLSGHRHYHRVVHHPHPHNADEGFWEITTASIIDWPSQARSVEVVQHSDGSIVIICTPIDHDGDLVPGPNAAASLEGIAGLHRELCANLVGTGAQARLARLTGRPEHGACLLGCRS
jgi:metallophosphoesterase (TIGR03767 family)